MSWTLDFEPWVFCLLCVYTCSTGYAELPCCTYIDVWCCCPRREWILEVYTMIREVFVLGLLVYKVSIQQLNDILIWGCRKFWKGTQVSLLCSIYSIFDWFFMIKIAGALGLIGDGEGGCTLRDCEPPACVWNLTLNTYSHTGYAQVSWEAHASSYRASDPLIC